MGVDIGDLAAPADVASAPEPGPAAANVTDEELADGVRLLAGRSHHRVLIELPEQADHAFRLATGVRRRLSLALALDG